MNGITPSTSGDRAISGLEHPNSGFFQALKDESISARLITPPGLIVLVIAITLSLLHGVVVLVNVGNTSAAAIDLATSIAFVTMFAIVLGSWLGLLFGFALIQLMRHALDSMEYRVISLVGVEYLETTSDDEDMPIEYWTSVVTWAFALSYIVLWCCLMFLIFQGYAYARSPSASSYIQASIAVCTALSYISAAVVALWLCWMGGIIINIWHRVRAMEKKVHPGTLDADIRALVPTNVSAIYHITRAHRQTARFVTGVF